MSNVFNRLLPSRDSVFWTLSSVGGFAAAVATHMDLFPWIPQHPQLKATLEIVSFAYTYFSGKMASSPIKS